MLTNTFAKEATLHLHCNRWTFFEMMQQQNLLLILHHKRDVNTENRGGWGKWQALVSIFYCCVLNIKLILFQFWVYNFHILESTPAFDSFVNCLLFGKHNITESPGPLCRYWLDENRIIFNFSEYSSHLFFKDDNNLLKSLHLVPMPFIFQRWLWCKSIWNIWILFNQFIINNQITKTITSFLITFIGLIYFIIIIIR